MTGGPEQYFTKEIQVTIKDKNNFSDESHKNMVLQNLRSPIASSDGESTDQQEVLYSADGTGNWAQSLWKTIWQSCEVKLHHSNLTHGNEPDRNSHRV